jgi:hypothetical protein
MFLQNSDIHRRVFSASKPRTSHQAHFSSESMATFKDMEGKRMVEKKHGKRTEVNKR